MLKEPYKNIVVWPSDLYWSYEWFIQVWVLKDQGILMKKKTKKKHVYSDVSSHILGENWELT